MEKKISDYVQALSSSDFDILEEIFLKKYRKFLRFYYIIEDHSDVITSIEYKKCEENKLKVAFSVSESKKSVNKILKELEESLNDDEDVLIHNKKNIITIEITKDESELP